MNLNDLEQIDSTFSVKSSNPDDINLVGISHSDGPVERTFCFVKSNKFYKRIGRRDTCSQKSYEKTGIILEESYFQKNADILKDLESRFAWVGTVSSIAKAMCDFCLLYTSPSPRDQRGSRMPSSA